MISGLLLAAVLASPAVVPSRNDVVYVTFDVVTDFQDTNGWQFAAVLGGFDRLDQDQDFFCEHKADDGFTYFVYTMPLGWEETRPRVSKVLNRELVFGRRYTRTDASDNENKVTLSEGLRDENIELIPVSLSVDQGIQTPYRYHASVTVGNRAALAKIGIDPPDARHTMTCTITRLKPTKY